MPPAVEGKSGLREVAVGRGHARRQESRSGPSGQPFGRHVICGDDDDPPGPTAAEHVLGDRQGHGGRGAARVDVKSRSLGPDELGEPRVAHRVQVRKKARFEAVLIR